MLNNDCCMTAPTTGMVYMVGNQKEEPLDLSKPTKEEYKNSKECMSYLSTSIRMSRKRQDKLLDELFRERCSEKEAQGMYDAHKEVVRRYEIYEEIEANG